MLSRLYGTPPKMCELMREWSCNLVVTYDCHKIFFLYILLTILGSFYCISGFANSAPWYRVISVKPNTCVNLVCVCSAYMSDLTDGLEEVSKYQVMTCESSIYIAVINNNYACNGGSSLFCCQKIKSWLITNEKCKYLIQTGSGF